jgi:antitoxin (DNA-binding transcriptional repressor) of toxin-antitoxin stability system
VRLSKSTSGSPIFAFVAIPSTVTLGVTLVLITFGHCRAMPIRHCFDQKWHLADRHWQMYCSDMIESNAASIAQNFTKYLEKVASGETIRIRDQGRFVARMMPDCDFMPGKQAAQLFAGHIPDAEAADAIASELRKLDLEFENALDH